MAMKPGDRLSMQGPYLNFIFPDDDKPAIMLAQGIGITPFRSMLLWAAKNQPDRLTVLIHVEGDSHTYRPETEQAASVARYVTNPVDFQTELDGAITAHPDAWLYVSGSPRFISSTTKLLTDHGISASRIKKDGFLGY
jgi:ferredoxin-NADP reductase